MRAVLVLLAAALVLAFLVAPAEAYRKRKGHGYKTPFWTKPQEEDLKIDVVSKPKDCKQKAKYGDKVKVHYTGALRESGKVFDSSVARGQPIEFMLGEGRVIPGWEQGVLGMCQGEKRKLSIPPSLAYGSRGIANVIPPNAYLLFSVELVGISANAAPPQVEESPQ